MTWSRALAMRRRRSPDGDVIEVVTLVGGGSGLADEPEPIDDRVAHLPEPALRRDG